MFQNKCVLVAGGTGLIGVQLVRYLIEQGAHVRIVSLDDPSRAHPEAEFISADLMELENCCNVCEKMDYVFNLLGVKGTPALAKSKPASNFYRTIQLSFNLLEAARKKEVPGFLYTSSIAVYAAAERFYEDSVWQTLPSENDFFPGWAKRTGELQVKAYRVQYGWENTTIVRPANVYGPFDNFTGENAMVIPSLIRKVLSGESPVTVWGDGSVQRDFVHSKDVALGMLIAAEHGAGMELNLGSGRAISIRELLQTIIDCSGKSPKIEWDTTKLTGDRYRILDISKAQALGYNPQVSLREGIDDLIQWHRENSAHIDNRYDVYSKNGILESHSVFHQ